MFLVDSLFYESYGTLVEESADDESFLELNRWN